jgi:transcriptional regulator with XRE-family HTH domain
LRFALDERRGRNRRYSLRAFAQMLGVDHSTLSQLMRGRRPLSARTIETLGRRLGLTMKQVRVFVEHRVASGPDLAILELTHRREFRPDSRWIAHELGVGIDEANVALQRLLRLDLLQMASVDRWIDKSGAR